MIQQIKQKLQVLNPTFLDIIDESDLHQGHAGHHEDGTSHVKVVISSKAFEDIKLIEKHRIVQNLLREELSGRLHALSIIIK